MATEKKDRTSASENLARSAPRRATGADGKSLRPVGRGRP
jgi:hypothetical protein